METRIKNPVSGWDYFATASAGTPLVVSPPYAGAIGRSNDVMCRVATDASTNSVAVAVWNTAEFQASVYKYMARKDHDISALKSIANWQRKQLNYQAVYNAYLLGALSEEEFERDAEQYSVELRERPVAELVQVLENVAPLLDFDLTPSEFADYLECEPGLVQEALEIAARNVPKLRQFTHALGYEASGDFTGFLEGGE